MKVYNDQPERVRNVVEAMYDEERGVAFNLIVEQFAELAAEFGDPLMAEKFAVVLQGYSVRH